MVWDFYKFITAFNEATKTGECTTVVLSEHDFLIPFLNFLVKEKLIEGWDHLFRWNGWNLKPELGGLLKIKSGTKLPSSDRGYIEVRLKPDVIKELFFAILPGKDSIYLAIVLDSTIMWVALSDFIED